MPRSVCARSVCCSHLKYTWQVLMVLTILCVALQLFGVVRQARQTKVIGPNDEQSGFRHLSEENKNGGILQSDRISFDLHQTDSQLFRRNDEKSLDTTPARRLASTINRILLPRVYQLPNKASPLKDANGEPWVDPEGINLSPIQNQNSENLVGTSPYIPTKDEFWDYPKMVKKSPTQNQNPEKFEVYQVGETPNQSENLKKLPRVSSEVPTKEEPGVYPGIVKQSPAQNQDSENLPRRSLEESRVYPEVIKQSPAQNPNFESLHRNSPQKSTVQDQNLTRDLPNTQQAVSYGVHANSNLQALHELSHDKSGVCQPKQHIVFLKTHKTASSTILNILYRYGEFRNLTFALPANMYSQLYYPYFFNEYFVEGVKFARVKEFHIMCNHMRFRGVEVRKVMPVDTFYFSILRNPVSMMESLFSYYKSIPAFNKFRTLTEFLLDGGRSYNASLLNNQYARNILTFDFGMDTSTPANKEELDKRSTALIAAVESNFHLILISDYFDESMILLKHTLCWTLEDVVSFRVNSRNDKSRSRLSPELAELVKQWSSLDWRLYQHFNATFWRRIDSLVGREKLLKEVELLRARRVELEQTCLKEGGAVDPDKVKDSSLKPFQYGSAVIQGYNIRPGLDRDTYHLCHSLTTPELQYTTALYTKQFPDLAVKRVAFARQAAARQAAARRSILTTRHSGNIKSASVNKIQSKTAATNLQIQNINSQRNTNAHLHTADSVHYANTQTLEKHSTVTKNKNLAQNNMDTMSDHSKHKTIEQNRPTDTSLVQATS